MTSPILRPCRFEDLLRCVNRDGWQGRTADLASDQLSRGVALTAEAEGQILGCAGVMVPWAGVGSAWMLLSEALNGHGKWLTSVVRHVLNDTARAQGLHRIEAVALAESERNRLWLERLGFTREQDGVARGYFADGRDAVRYERIHRG